MGGDASPPESSSYSPPEPYLSLNTGKGPCSSNQCSLNIRSPAGWHLLSLVPLAQRGGPEEQEVRPGEHG